MPDPDLTIFSSAGFHRRVIDQHYVGPRTEVGKGNRASLAHLGVLNRSKWEAVF